MKYSLKQKLSAIILISGITLGFLPNTANNLGNCKLTNIHPVFASPNLPNAVVQQTTPETKGSTASLKTPNVHGKGSVVYIAHLEHGVDTKALAEKAKATILSSNPSNFVTLAFDSVPSVQQLNSISQLPGVLEIKSRKIFKALGSTDQTTIPNITDSYYSQQWNLTQTNVLGAWQQGATGKGMVVAVIDTGVDLNHPDLKNNLVAGYNAITKSEAGSAAQDDNGHGTHVAGIIAAALNGSGIVGVAYGAKVMPVKVLDRNGEGGDDVIADGIYWAVNHGAKIINLSLGGEASTGILGDALNYAAAKGCLIVAAAGNDSNSTVSYPASDPNALAVTSMNQSGQLSGFSNTGSAVALAAPGEQIVSDFWDSAKGSGYATASGTSMASPLVAGVAALVWGVHPDWNSRQVRIDLEDSAKNLGNIGRDDSYGFGEVDALNAINFAANQVSVSSPATIAAPGGSVSYLNGSETIELKISAGTFQGTANFSINGTKAPGDFPQGITPGGEAFNIQWDGTPRKILRLDVKSPPPPDPNLVGYIYYWSGSRWLLVGGVASGAIGEISTGVFEPGIYCLGYSKPSPVNRLSGLDRIQTAICIAQTAFPTGADTVIIARSDDFPDALAGAPLAYKEHAPILLTDPNSLRADVFAEIQALRPQKILILGGSGAVSNVVASRLATVANVQRLSGDNRYSTAAQIARYLGTYGKAVIVNGENYPDAISIASEAAINGEPIILTPASGLTPESNQVLREQSVSDSLIVGGTGVVSPAGAALLANPLRLAGKDRYETNAAVLSAFAPICNQVFVATGNDFPDALTGGVLAAIKGTSVVLVQPIGLTSAQTGVLQNWHGKTVVAFVGEAVVSTKTLNMVQALIQ